MFDWLMKIIDNAKGTRQTASPMWHSTGSRMRKSRTPFQSQRRRKIYQCKMQVESFRDKDERLARFKELRAQGTPDVCKWSGGDEQGSIWYVAHN